MMPMYMNSSQPGQMRPQGHYHQGFGNYPQHITTDASSPASCEHWPSPSPCYGSCIHGNFPAYTPYWPPCYPPQVPYHTCCMNNSGFQPHAPPYYIHQPFPVGYHPGYDFEKDVPGKHHCTKCLPQMGSPRNDTSVVIEEHQPESEKGKEGALLPLHSTDCSYPVIWIPHENAMNQKHGSSLGSGSHEQPPPEIKAPENMKVQKSDPKSWNGFFPFDESTMKSLIQNQDRKKIQNGKSVELPFDISKLKTLLQGLDGKEAHMQKNKDESGQRPYPIFWIPSPEKREDVEGSEIMGRSNEECNLKPFPSGPNVSEGQVAQHRGEEGNFECKVRSDADERSSMRNIPVENHLQEPRNIPVKLSANHLPKPTEPTKRIAKNEPVENTKKEQSSSSPKASRLPPVCLRVDPLPKKRNGVSKSLSPPRRKELPLTSEETKVSSPLSSKKAETTFVPEACNVKCEEANKEKKMSEGRTEKELVESNPNLQGGVKSEIGRTCETKEGRERAAKKPFTEEEAARIIQSRYRGYDVRRWEPIKKLKEIATVREQMGDVKKRIQALEVSNDQHIEEKEIVILGEMVMSLLLKLDSVQGLHPSIRDYRKSLARELSDIQEKLDSLRKSGAEKEAVEEQVEITSQTGDCPVNLEGSHLAEENKLVSDTNTEKVLPLSPEENSPSLMNLTDEQLVAEAEDGTGLTETQATYPEQTSICEVATIPEKIGEAETVLPINPLAADGNGTTVMKPEEDKAMVEEPPHELPQIVETTRGPDFEAPKNDIDVCETVADASENEERKGDDVEFSELPVGVNDDDTQLLSQDSSSCTCAAETTALDAETKSQEETNVDRSCDHSKGIVQETSKPQEEMEQPPETAVIGHEISEETKKLMEENQRFKETMETLVKAGREQLEVISKLTGRVKSLEKKLSKKKRTQIRRPKPNRGKNATKPMSASLADAVM